ncbi:hypothetical protein [Spongiactinospora sp. TRM90649]|uniref:hypothetical protein n=1 Tax=Spongiactinospora sp. TRM90649 TaxID=3031114 RepID=UPI0023F931DA|nr:hypothetical protein [Spongiactinospora sp. TRM90649]MDF5755598.1 hypothetical protein [Spongiactinospora sp. TRM90649]
MLYAPELDIPPLRLDDTEFDKGFMAGFERSADKPVVRPVAHVMTQQAEGWDIYHRARIVRKVHALEAKVEPGFSGAPVLRDGVNVVGMVLAAATDQPGRGYALTVAEIARGASLTRAATRKVSTDKCE